MKIEDFRRKSPIFVENRPFRRNRPDFVEKRGRAQRARGSVQQACAARSEPHMLLHAARKRAKASFSEHLYDFRRKRQKATLGAF